MNSDRVMIWRAVFIRSILVGFLVTVAVNTAITYADYVERRTASLKLEQITNAPFEDYVTDYKITAPFKYYTNEVLEFQTHRFANGDYSVEYTDRIYCPYSPARLIASTHSEWKMASGLLLTTWQYGNRIKGDDFRKTTIDTPQTGCSIVSRVCLVEIDNVTIPPKCKMVVGDETFDIIERKQ